MAPCEKLYINAPSLCVKICGANLFFVLTNPQMHAIMKRQYMLSLLHRTIREYRSLVKQYPASSCDAYTKLTKGTPVSLSNNALACRVRIVHTVLIFWSYTLRLIPTNLKTKWWIHYCRATIPRSSLIPLGGRRSLFCFWGLHNKCATTMENCSADTLPYWWTGSLPIVVANQQSLPIWTRLISSRFHQQLRYFFGHGLRGLKVARFT